ncbi:MAG: TonB-dependent receptor [Dysgonamonadaceae bacterium]|nr:TonB-dependent receptor [Dysgonamonadaceae bacterium]
MRISLFFILLPVLSIYAADGYAQTGEAKFRLNLRSTIKEATKEIEKNSNYVFVFSDNVDHIANKQIDLNINADNIENVMDSMLAGTNGVYHILGNQIVIYASNASVSARTVERSVSITTTTQQQRRTIRGTVIDFEGEPLPGAAVMIAGSTRGVTTDIDGTFSVEVESSEKLVFSYIGYDSQTVEVGNQTEINIVLHETADMLEEFTVVAFGRQRRESVIASVSTVAPSELQVPSSNLTTAFAGRIAGLISYQRTGEPGADNAQFFIRGVTSFGTGRVSPLILIDGVEMSEDDLARLTTDDIASFSIMKDANATALYGARGANGVILVTTKEGRQGAMKIQFRAEGSFSSPTENVAIADPVTFMRMHNESVRTRFPGIRLPYDESKIINTERGFDPLRYPANDWQDLLFDKNTFNHRYNLNISGGGSIARYFVAASYAVDNGIIKVDPRLNFNNNININKYTLRANVNVDLTRSTELVVRLHGAFDDYQGPLDSGTLLYNKAVVSNPVLFQPYYAPDAANIHTNHILFGNAPSGNFLNPYADMLRGYRHDDRSSMSAQFEARQKLDFITEGLFVRALYNVNRFSRLEVRRAYNPFYYALAPQGPGANEYLLMPLNPNSGTDYLDYVPGSREMNNNMYFEGAIQYNTIVANRHTLSGLLVFTARERKDNASDQLLLSLPQRNAGIAGRATYSFDNRYFVEANFGYNGSERFSKNERWGFFPSAGLGYVVTNEAFMEPYLNTIAMLKLKATYGLVGNDEIGRREDRFYYLSNVNMSDSDRGIAFGDTWNYNRNGISISRYADPYITWEISRKSNYGIELNLWNQLEIHVDYFRENRSNILQPREDIPTTMGLQAIPRANIGEASGSGVDFSVDYSRSFSRDLWAVARGTFTYASSKFKIYEEPNFSNVPWRSRVGQRISQQWGYIAERLFIDDEDVRNSPKQTFGDYGAGDIKYKDINGDGIIDENDMVPIGFPTTPEINYGFGLTVGYKKIDFSCFFQGSARSSFWINPARTAPFVQVRSQDDQALFNAIDGRGHNRAVLQAIADSHWSEDSRDLYAFWPRLSPIPVENNQVRSTWWMRNGSFLRLKSVEVGYKLPAGWVQPAKIQNARIYASGNNLFFVARSFKMWDPELAGNPFNYPLQRVFNVGVTLDF